MSSSGDAKECAVCGAKFGLMLWRHKCSKCQRTVCDDCAPHVAPASGQDSVRICQHCLTNAMTTASSSSAAAAVRARAGANGANNNNSGSSGGGRRLGTAAEQTRASSQHSSGNSQPAQGSNNASSAASTAAATTATSSNNNPVLEAALRRQQQSAMRGHGGSAGVAGAAYSPEKLRLLREIDSVLAAHADVPPFGLRSADEAKLRGYLTYLKSKYNVA